MTNNDKFEPSKVGAIVGGLSGGVGGAVADKRWRARCRDRRRRRRGGRLAAVQQAAEPVGVRGEVQAAHERRGRGKIKQNQRNETSSGGSLQGNTGVGSGGSSANDQTKVVDWDVASNCAVQTRYFAVAVEGGAFSTEAGRAEAAKAVLLDRLPGFLMGGNVVDF